MGWDQILTTYWGDVIRVLIACVLGLALGAERALREKEAGIRTHLILIVGATLITCVSNYYVDNARITAMIVSGVGFIGAGIIMFRGETLHGITTATGIWTTAGIGIAVGNNLFLLAVACTVLVIIFQVAIQAINLGLIKTYRYLRITFLYNDKTKEHLRKVFKVKNFARLKIYQADEKMYADMVLKTSEPCNVEMLTELLEGDTNIISLERLDVNQY